MPTLVNRLAPYVVGEAPEGQEFIASISPDGTRGAKADWKGPVVIVSLPMPSAFGGRIGSFDHVGTLEWSPDSRFLIHGRDFEGYVDIFDAHTQQLALSLPHEGRGGLARITDDGDLLCIARRDKLLEVHDVD